eukprot:TRINITY_DN35023_c0_g1_i3.p1 TRINITY_DN35023_c0_g1~~TRINITY_DN35023_c0_g1_i3.p1  ORF type:complete len:424 (-),score=77.80 TRINITY_DN35023_c0_g1_i3:58-1329(-)
MTDLIMAAATYEGGIFCFLPTMSPRPKFARPRLSADGGAWPFLSYMECGTSCASSSTVPETTDSSRDTSPLASPKPMLPRHRSTQPPRLAEHSADEAVSPWSSPSTSGIWTDAALNKKLQPFDEMEALRKVSSIGSVCQWDDSKSIAPSSFLGCGAALRASQGGIDCQGRQTCADEPLSPVSCPKIAQLRARLAAATSVAEADIPDDIIAACVKVCHNDLNKAFDRASETLRWRLTGGINGILEDPMALVQEEALRPVLRYALPGCDRQRRPVMIQAVGKWDMEALNRLVRDKRQEMLRRQWLQSVQASDKPQNCRWVVLMDMEGLTLWHTRYPEVLACLKEVSLMSSKYYPESLDSIFVCNAPTGFSFIWSLIGHFMKPKTRSKVRVLPKGDFSDLVSECGEECLPKQFGGILPRDTFPCLL